MHNYLLEDTNHSRFHIQPADMFLENQEILAVGSPIEITDFLEMVYPASYIIDNIMQNINIDNQVNYKFIKQDLDGKIKG